LVCEWTEVVGNNFQGWGIDFRKMLG